MWTRMVGPCKEENEKCSCLFGCCFVWMCALEWGSCIHFWGWGCGTKRIISFWGLSVFLFSLKSFWFSIYHQIVPETAKKAVFIANGPFHGTSYEVLKSLVKRSNLEYCVIITTVNSAVHDILRGSKDNNDYESFHIIEEDVLNWMGNMVSIRIRIFYQDLFSNE